MSNLSYAIKLSLACPLCQHPTGLTCEVGYASDEGDVYEDGTWSGPRHFLMTNLLRVNCFCDFLYSMDELMDAFDAVNEEGKDSYERPEEPLYPL